jgi:two-component system, NtrC family, nitrogen regulation response regulator GlnG
MTMRAKPSAARDMHEDAINTRTGARIKNTMPTIWVVDDDRAVRFVLATALRDVGYTVASFDSAAPVREALARGERPQLLFTDVRMPGDDGLVLLDAIKQQAPSLPVIVMSAYTDVASTAGAFRGGAHEFLSKPFDLDDVVALAARALQNARQPGDVDAYAADDDSESLHKDPSREGGEHANDDGEPLVGNAPAMRALFRAIGRLAQAPLGVLITGETGTGKELVARALHRESARAKRPFVALNTAAIPAELLESELFGHEAGAFTGASKRHIGRFEQAEGGTLFLDEIGDMPLPLQTRLLRVLAESEFFRVGGRELIRVDVRVIAATHQDLQTLVTEGRFRADLLHRLDVVRLQLPPLRERREDVPLLAERFMRTAAQKLGAPVKRFAPTALARLQTHAWPGNVRELENLCWRLVALAPSERILAADLDAVFAPMSSLSDIASQGERDALDWETPLAAWARRELSSEREDLHDQARERFDRVLLDAALERTGGHRSEAATRLGLSRNTVTRKLGPGRKPRKPT